MVFDRCLYKFVSLIFAFCYSPVCFSFFSQILQADCNAPVFLQMFDDDDDDDDDMT